MKKVTKRVCSLLLSFCLVSGTLFSVPLRAEAREELVNVARKEGVKITVQNTGSGSATDMVDGNDKTSWQQNGWSTNKDAIVDMKLAENGTNVKKVVVKVGGNDYANRKVKVTVQRAQNGITSDWISIGETVVTTTGKANETVDAVFELAQTASASDIRVVLSQPVAHDGGEVLFWPSIHEIEVYEMQEVHLSDYNNIAAQAQITTDGNENPSEGKDRLVDDNDKTLYKFHNAAQDSEKYIQLSFGEDRMMDACEIAFEHVGATDQYTYEFTYSILGKAKGAKEYTKIVDHAKANRTDKFIQGYKFDETAYSDVKIVIHSTKNSQGNGWPAVAEFRVYGAEEKVDDSASIAFKKPVHANSNQKNASKVNDGSKNTMWSGEYYPGYVDIDLQENYNLDTVEIFTQEKGYSQYSIYTSMNGRDFDKLAEKTSTESCTDKGEIYQANKKEARIIRVYMEYNSANTAAVIKEIRATGKKSGTKVQTLPNVAVKDFKDSSYAGTEKVTPEQTYEEVRGIIERRLGAKYKAWFDLKLQENPNKTGYDYFELSDNNGKVQITGNDGVSLAMGLNHYLKYFCNVNISQVGDQADMPKNIVPVGKKVHKETKVGTRYSYNYCTLSYSMAFWGEEEWRNELDWLALNGVNVVLDATAQEEVWRRFLGSLGYTHEEIKDYIAGPAYYAWAYMANLSGFGGPIHDSWFEERTELARKNHLSMRRLGMQPVLQGYSGMVPTNIREKDPSAEVIEQGTWCSFRRPDMLKTDSASFEKYAKLFYKAQKEVYGESAHYYATDPFHEGGNTGGLNPTVIAKKVLDTMLAADKDAIWIIQSWQGNPTTALLKGLEGREKHALVLDLYAEKTPHWNEENPNAYGGKPGGGEFHDTPWVFCMLNNFGGRLGLHGHLDNLAKNIPAALNRAKHMEGIGITPEASVNNPLLYDFLFETVWTDNANQKLEEINLDNWLKNYAKRRYGKESQAAYESLLIMKDTVYKADLNMLGQGAPESVVNARPALDISAASTWGNAIISYDKEKLEKAANLLLKDYEQLKNSNGYMYDLATILQQVLSNSAQEYQRKMTSAFKAKNKEEFNKYANTFLNIIDNMEKVTSTSKYYLLGTWVEQAKALAKNADDFTKDLYEFNAKALVTTWGSINQAEGGGLKDYSNRQWSGLLKDFYKVRWQKWIQARNDELDGKKAETINWFEWEWKWVRENTKYSNTPNKQNLNNLNKIGETILNDFSVKDPNADDSKDIKVEGIKATAGSEQSKVPGEEGAAVNVLDNNSATIWHSAWSGTERKNLWLQLELPKAQKVNGIRLQTRSSYNNGFITKYRIETSMDGEKFTEVASGDWDQIPGWKKASFNEREAKFVRLYAVESYSNDGKNYASAAEMRLTEEKAVVVKPDTKALSEKLKEAKALETKGFTTSSVATLEKAIQKAEKVIAEATEQSEINAMVEELSSAMQLVKSADAKESQKELDNLVKNVKEENAYTKDSWDVYVAAKAKVEKAIQNPSDVSEKEMKAFLTELSKAVDGLEKKPVVKPDTPENSVKPQQKPSQKPEQKPSHKVPKTSDTTNGLGFMLLAIMAGGCIVFIETKRFRRMNK
ncbi:alpha-N-acetylglucosaminidase TIM-barrel domain-containing protein [Faecalimonas sp.]